MSTQTKCKKCGKDMKDEEYCYNFPDGIQCIDCGKDRKIFKDNIPKNYFEEIKKCEECGMEMLLLEWTMRNHICVVCSTKKELQGATN